LLHLPSWKRFKRLAREHDDIKRSIYKATLKSKFRPTKFKYGFQVPYTHADVILLDDKAGNNLWKESERTEINSLNEYIVFKDIGKGGVQVPPSDYKKIRCHMVYDVKHDGRHKSRLIAGGHLTPEPEESIYSGVVLLRSLRLIIFIAELNKLQLWGADVSSAYLEATTKEKVYFIAGGEFGEKEGNTLMVEKALYGLRSSGLR
jgi:Reverse transcriptase (RNA-dependent DNA polymerase)